VPPCPTPFRGSLSFPIRAFLFGYASGLPDNRNSPGPVSQTPHYSFGSLTRPLIQHSFARSPLVIASGSSHSLLSVSFTFGIIFPTPRGSLHPQACTFPRPRFASLLLAFARIWLSIHSKVHFLYRSFAHIFSLANITCTTPHIISKPTMLPCTSYPGHTP
jgi:hypothetical protein